MHEGVVRDDDGPAQLEASPAGSTCVHGEAVEAGFLVADDDGAWLLGKMEDLDEPADQFLPLVECEGLCGKVGGAGPVVGRKNHIAHGLGVGGLGVGGLGVGGIFVGGIFVGHGVVEEGLADSRFVVVAAGDALVHMERRGPSGSRDIVCAIGREATTQINLKNKWTSSRE